MDWFIHHVNIQAYDVPEAVAFYRDIVGMREAVWSYPDAAGDFARDPSSVAAFGSRNRGLHIVRAVPDFGLRNKLHHNPTIAGHFAISVRDADQVKRRLETAGHLVSDAGVYAMAGVRQLYVYDPFQNLVEINEIVDDAEGPRPAPGEAHNMRMEDGDWHLHHVNLPAHDVILAAAFYRDLIGLAEGVWRTPASAQFPDLTANRAMLTYFGDTGYRGLHLVKPNDRLMGRSGFQHNPTIGGHFAISVKDLAGVIARLRLAGTPFSDAGTYAMAGIHQLYVYDPSMNLVEINQVVDPLA
jgi:catechol 2,3-dioxygenase-like lactoylglutathione lyase family enzyme